ncbi:MAG: hypothetical protein BWY02_02810 [bacterium ADurb.Bin157]|nr:MAG: hypothetical protein BWY02_02810 [bacterium ADurb.Bin157]
MKTKTYTFTEEEILTLRNAVIEYYQMIKSLKPNSPIAIRNQANAKALKDQFIQDATTI